MKKLLLLGAFVIGAFASNAQTQFVQLTYDPSLMSYSPGVIALGNNDVPPSCRSILSSARTSIPFGPMGVTLDATIPSTWLPSATATEFADFNIEMIGGGMYYGAWLPSCGGPLPKTYTLNYPFIPLTVYADVSISGATTVIYLHP